METSLPAPAPSHEACSGEGMRDWFELLPGSEPTSVGQSVVASTHRLFSVRLWGPLHPLWADRVTRGLAGVGVSILNGVARLQPTGSWSAEFLVSPVPGGANPETIDYVSLTLQPPPPHAPPLVLDSFDVDGSPEHGGFVYLEVRGPDRVGFLGSLLRILAEQELVPREMWVATRYGEACDRFLLATAHGRTPTDAQRQALEEVLGARRRREPLPA
jgi:hypothetical protein